MFVEGWALYSENPLLSDDVDLYKDNMLQKYGMYKWQVRGVRIFTRRNSPQTMPSISGR